MDKMVIVRLVDKDGRVEVVAGTTPEVTEVLLAMSGVDMLIITPDDETVKEFVVESGDIPDEIKKQLTENTHVERAHVGNKSFLGISEHAFEELVKGFYDSPLFTACDVYDTLEEYIKDRCANVEVDVIKTELANLAKAVKHLVFSCAHSGLVKLKFGTKVYKPNKALGEECRTLESAAAPILVDLYTKLSTS